jgi:hypothetical protein
MKTFVDIFYDSFKLKFDYCVSVNSFAETMLFWRWNMSKFSYTECSREF